MDITSRYDGKVVKLYYKEGEVAKVGAPLVDIEVEDSAPGMLASVRGQKSLCHNQDKIISYLSHLP